MDRQQTAVALRYCRIRPERNFEEDADAGIYLLAARARGQILPACFTVAKEGPVPGQINHLLLACFGILVALSVADLILTRRLRRFALEVTCLALAFLVLRLTTGFPAASGFRGQGFGPGDNPWPMIGLVFVCILLGMAARYFFHLKGALSWRALLRPLCVSPIVVLPLLGTLEDVSQLQPLQVVSFCVLAFQSGFFWRVVFERAQASLKLE